MKIRNELILRGLFTVEQQTSSFFMCPPFEIVGRGKKLVVSHRGHFEISENRITYKIANTIIDFLVLYPTEGTGEFTELPPESNFDSYQ